MYFDRLISTGFIIVLIGVVIIMSGIFLSTFNQGQDSKIETAGVILIGPIPIIFGNSKSLIFISIAGALILMIVYFLMSRGGFIR